MSKPAITTEHAAWNAVLVLWLFGMKFSRDDSLYFQQHKDGTVSRVRNIRHNTGTQDGVCATLVHLSMKEIISHELASSMEQRINRAVKRSGIGVYLFPKTDAGDWKRIAFIKRAISLTRPK